MGGMNRLWLTAILVTLSIVCYCRSLNAPFVFDDLLNFDEQGQLLSLDARTRPVITLTWWANHALGGTSTFGYRALNLIVHVLCSVALHGLLLQLLPSVAPRRIRSEVNGIAFLTALLWTCHPIQTQSTAYVSQRAESIAALFYLLFLQVFIRSRTSQSARLLHALALTMFAIGLASKETVATAPFLALVLDRHLTGSWTAALRERWLFYAMAFLVLAGLGACFIAPHLLGAETAGFAMESLSSWEYARSQPGVLLHYVRLAFWPHPLCLDYAWPVAVGLRDYLFPGTIVIIALAATAWAVIRKRAAGLAGAWIFILLAPTSSIVPIADLAFEHRMYLALAGLLVLGIMLADEALRYCSPPRALRSLRITLSVLALLAACVLTLLRADNYRSSLTLWRKTAEVSPNNSRALANYGRELIERGRFAEAASVLRRAVEIEPENAVGWLNLSANEYALAAPRSSAECARRAVALAPNNPRARRALARALLAIGDPAEAEAHLRVVVASASQQAIDHFLLGNALQLQGRHSAAVEHFETGLRERPDHPDALTNIGVSLMALGRARDARPLLLRALELPPETAVEHLTLGRCERLLGENAEALESFRAALLLDPDLHEAAGAAARVLVRLPDAGAAQHEEALHLASSAVRGTAGQVPTLLESLAIVWSSMGRTEEAAEALELALALPAIHGDPELLARLRARLEVLQDPTADE
jgi:tetratricopeptide (TPR) repeat protein